MTNTSPKATTAVATTTTPTKKRPPGRWKATIPLEELRRVAAQGLSGEQIAMCLGCAERTLWLRMSESPEVRAAFHEGNAAGVDKASATLWELIDQGNIARLIFYLRSCGGWRAAASQVKNTVHHPSAPYPIITSHVLDMAREHSLLLDSPDPDLIKAEFSDVTEGS